MATLRLQSGGVAFGLCLYLASKPGSALFSGEIQERWDVDHRDLHSRMKRLISLGYIERFKVKGERQYCYTAGPKLKEAA